MHIPANTSLFPALPRFAAVHALLPGTMLCALVAIAATFLSERAGGPALLHALLLGLAFNFLAADARLAPGIALCGRTALHLGVALLGACITVRQIVKLGTGTALGIAAALAGTILVGLALAALLRRPRVEGILSGCAVGICGASAALAVSAVLPPTRENERFTLLVVVGVTLLSTVAMVVYPLLLATLGIHGVTAGVILGGSIHDVAHVVAAGTMMGPETAPTAAIVKLFRVALLGVVVMLVAVSFRSVHTAAARRPPLVPAFVIGFVALAVLASLGWVPPAAMDALGTTSRWLLVLAIAACGIKTSLADLRLLGWRPVLMLVFETAFIGLAAGAVALTFAH